MVHTILEMVAGEEPPSFGNYLSASGGLGANQTYQHCGGLGGLGSGGNLNIYGGGGTGSHELYGDLVVEDTSGSGTLELPR